MKGLWGITGLWTGLLDLLYPAAAGCPLCGARPDERAGPPAPTGPQVCNTCLERHTLQTADCCPRCGRPAGAAPRLCADCRRRPPRFERCVAAGAYRGMLRDAVHRLKFRRDSSLAHPLAAWLARRIQTEFPPSLLVPMPLHPTRLRERGFNQAERLAAAVAKRLHWPYLPHAVRRVRPTPAQSQLDRAERLQNLRGAFQVVQPAAVRGAHILLIDDVITTGASLSELAASLYQAGARRVDAAVLAATPPPSVGHR